MQRASDLADDDHRRTGARRHARARRQYSALPPESTAARARSAPARAPSRSAATTIDPRPRGAHRVAARRRSPPARDPRAIPGDRPAPSARSSPAGTPAVLPAPAESGRRAAWPSRRSLHRAYQNGINPYERLRAVLKAPQRLPEPPTTRRIQRTSGSQKPRICRNRNSPEEHHSPRVGGSSPSSGTFLRHHDVCGNSLCLRGIPRIQLRGRRLPRTARNRSLADKTVQRTVQRRAPHGRRDQPCSTPPRRTLLEITVSGFTPGREKSRRC